MCSSILTLYDPKSKTWHVIIASRPTAAVTLVIGAENLGSVERLTGFRLEISKFLILFIEGSMHEVKFVF